MKKKIDSFKHTALGVKVFGAITLNGSGGWIVTIIGLTFIHPAVLSAFTKYVPLFRTNVKFVSGILVFWS